MEDSNKKKKITWRTVNIAVILAIILVVSFIALGFYGKPIKEAILGIHATPTFTTNLKLTPIPTPKQVCVTDEHGTQCCDADQQSCVDSLTPPIPQNYNQPYQASANTNTQTQNYQNYGWYQHNGQSMQYVNGSWFSTPQQGQAAASSSQGSQQANEGTSSCTLSTGTYQLTPQQCSYYQSVDSSVQQQVSAIKEQGQIIQQQGQDLTNQAIQKMSAIAPLPNFPAPTVAAPAYQPMTFTTPTTVCYDPAGQVIPNCH